MWRFNSACITRTEDVWKQKKERVCVYFAVDNAKIDVIFVLEDQTCITVSHAVHESITSAFCIIIIVLY